MLSCLVSCHLRDVAGESRRLVDNQVEGLQQADTSSRMNTAILGAFFVSTYRQQVAAHTGRTIARRQRHGDSLLQAFRGRQHLGSNVPPVLSAGRRREEPRTYLRLPRTARTGSTTRWTEVLVPFASLGGKPGPSNKDAGRRSRKTLTPSDQTGARTSHKRTPPIDLRGFIWASHVYLLQDHRIVFDFQIT